MKAEDFPLFQVDADYMSKKADITERMRGILIDWLIQVHLKFKLLQETLYLTVAILDRFLSMSDIKRGKYPRIVNSVIQLLMKNLRRF